MYASCTLHWSTWSCMLHVHYTGVHGHVCFMYTTLEYTWSCMLHVHYTGIHGHILLHVHYTGVHGHVSMLQCSVVLK